MVSKVTAGLLSAADDQVRNLAMKSLMQMGSAAAAAVPGLVALVRQNQSLSEALTVLGNIGPRASSVVPALSMLLSIGREVDGVLSCAAQLGPAAVGLSEQAVGLLQSPDAIVRCRAATALMAMEQGEGKPYSDRLARVLLHCSMNPTLALVDRLRAANDLVRMKHPLAVQTRGIQRALSAKQNLLNSTQAGQQQAALCNSRGERPDRTAARDLVAAQFDICRREVGLPGQPFGRLSMRVTTDPRGDLAMGCCLGSRLCGPQRLQAWITVLDCCDRSYQTQPPPWCQRNLLKSLMYFFMPALQ